MSDQCSDIFLTKYSNLNASEISIVDRFSTKDREIDQAMYTILVTNTKVAKTQIVSYFKPCTT